MIKFEVWIDGKWTIVDGASICRDSRFLNWHYQGRRGNARLSEWRLAESTTTSLDFKIECLKVLEREGPYVRSVGSET